MSTPICHRTIGPDQAHGDYTPQPRECIGSRCMLWTRTKSDDMGRDYGRCFEAPEWSQHRDPAQGGPR